MTGYSAYNAIPGLIMDHGVITTGGMPSISFDLIISLFF
jgi:hypothetical protein